MLHAGGEDACDDTLHIGLPDASRGSHETRSVCKRLIDQAPHGLGPRRLLRLLPDPAIERRKLVGLETHAD